ncbi:MAG TPA: CPBP family intramembrane glutamic endopeptidase [Rubrobacteraceae bacterium]|nr:CPBP family intramembrane glutamic endopeptidase [Rubrobacteraceae bacterium]
MQLFFEERERRPRAVWRLLAQVVIFQAATFLFFAPLAAVWSLASSAETFSDGSVAAFAESPTILLFGSISSLGAVFLSLWLAGRFFDRRPFRDFGFHLDGGWWLDLAFGLALGAVLMSGIFLVEISLGWVRVEGTFESGLPGTPFWVALALPIVIFLCVGVYEEAFSRGYELLNMAEGLNYPFLGPRGAIAVAWVLSSGIFGILHLGNPNATPLSAFNIALAGLLLGAGYILTGELAIPIGLHITWNFFQGNVFGFPVSGLGPVGATFLSTEQGGTDLWTGGEFGPEAGLMDPIATLIGISLIALWVRLRRGHVGIHTSLAEPPKTVPETSEE